MQVRRCNNTVKWLDSNDVLHTEPCVFDYTLKDTSFDYDKQMNMLAGDFKIWVQDNSITNTFYINQRFIFNGYAYIINNINKQSMENMLTITLTEVVVSADDDLVNNIIIYNPDYLFHLV